MKKHELPNKDEWEKIVDEAFSSDEKHSFSENYKMKKNSILKGAIIMKKHNILMNLTVTAAALAVVAFPTGIYFATRTAETTPATQLPAEEETSKLASQVAEKENDTIYEIEYGWLPEGFERNDDESYSYFTNANKDKIFMITSFVKNLSGEKTENGVLLTVRDKYNTDDKTIDIRYQDNYVENSTDKDCTNYGRVATVYFKDTPYELEVFITDDITKDDFKKILENVRLVPSDTETADIYQGETVTETEMTITDGEDDGQVNEEIHQFTEDDIDYDTIYDVEYGWLPEGLEYQEDGPYATKFHNFNNERTGMTPAFVKNLSGEDIELERNFTVLDEYQTDGKTVQISYRGDYEENADNHNYGRIACIYFDNTPYILSLWVTDNITKEDFAKIIENVKLVPSDTETASIYQGATKTTEEKIEFTVGSYEDAGIPIEESNIVQVGEEVYEKNPDAFGNISAKITGVRFDDDFNGLTTDKIGNPADFSQYLHEDGKLIENVRIWHSYENNEEKVIGTGESPVSVMTMSVTYTNNGTAPTGFGGYCIYPSLQTTHDGYFFTLYDYNVMEMEAQLEETMVDYTDNYQNISGGGAFSFSSPNQEGKNEIHLDAGESAEVTLAFIVEDKFRDNLYLSMNGNGFVDLSNIE